MNVFISYATEDAAFVQGLEKTLVSAGLEVIRAERLIQPGDTWTERIVSAIDAADVILFVLTPRSSRSEFVRTEVALAVSAQGAVEGKLIVPVIAEGPIDLPFFLRHLQYVDLSDSQSYERNLSSLLNAIETISDQSSPEAQLYARRRILELGSSELLLAQEAEIFLHEDVLKKLRLVFSSAAASIGVGFGIGLVTRNPEDITGWVVIGLALAVGGFLVAIDVASRIFIGRLGFVAATRIWARVVRWVSK